MTAAALEGTHRPIVVAIFNQKGGIGKTTTSVNLAVCLAAFGKAVTLIDLDAQSNATSSLGHAAVPSVGAYGLIAGAASLDEVTVQTRIPNVSVCAATDELAGAELELALAEDPQHQLARALRHIHGAEYVIIDCPPALSMLPVNALAAADLAILPVSPEPMARDGLHKAWHHIQRIRANLNPRLEVAGILVTMIDDQAVHASLAETIRAEFGERVFPFAIPRDRAVVEACTRDMPVALISPDSPSSQAYLTLAAHLLAASPGRKHPTVEPDDDADDDEAERPPSPTRPDTAAAAATLRQWGSELGTPPAAHEGPGPTPDPTWTVASLPDYNARAANGVWWWKLGVAVLLFLLGVVIGLSAAMGWIGKALE